MKRALIFIWVLLFLVISGMVKIDGIAEISKEEFKGVVTGRVVMPDGSPAVQANVEACSWQDWSGPCGAAKTDESGGFKMTLPPGEYWFNAKVGNFCQIWYNNINVREDGSVSGTTEICLQEGCVVYGKVVDKTTGNPVGGALIVTDAGDRTVTANDGTFRLEGVLKKDHAIVAAKEGLYRPVVYFDTTGRPSTEIFLETKPGGTIKGVVTNEKGEPIAGAIVRDHRSGSIWICGLQKVKTNERGEYSLSGYDPDNPVRAIGVEASGYSGMSKSNIQFPSGRHEVKVYFQLSSQQNIVTTAHVSGGSTTKKLRKISGSVTKEDGTPVRDALVAYGGSTSYIGYKAAQTDTDGKFLLEGVETGNDIVVVQADGLAPEFKTTGTTEDVRLDFLLKPGHWVEGRIVDNEGNPVAGIHISTMAESSEMVTCDRSYRYLRPTATTDTEGKFRLENLPAGRVFIDAFGSNSSRISNLALEVDKNDHMLTILPPGQISGTVLKAEDNKPVTQFKVFLGFPEKREPQDKYSGFSAAYSSSGISFNSPDGTFTISDLNTGDTLRMIVDAAGFRREAIDRVIVQSVSRIDYNAVIFNLQTAQAFEGLVVESESGKGIEDVLVTLLDTGTRGSGSFSWNNRRSSFHPVSVKTDTQGKFRIDSVPVRRGTVMLEKTGFARTLLRDVDFYKFFKAEIPNGAMIRGIATDDTGKPLAGARVDADLEEAISFGRIEADKDGKFCFTDLPPGEYQIRRVEGNKWVKLHDVILSPGEDYTVDWDRPGEVEIEGIVQLKGAPAAEIDVRIHPVGESKLCAFGKTGEDGQYRLSIMKAGRYYISFQKGDWMDPNKIYVRKTVTLNPGKNHFDMILPGASIKGRVINKKTSEPVANVNVRSYLKQREQEIFGEDSWSSQHTMPYWYPKNVAKTDKNGQFEIENMPPGEWLIAQEIEKGPRVPGKPFNLKEDEKKNNIIFKIPDVGSAKIVAIDPNSGEIISDAVYFTCVNEWGFPFFPEMEEDKSCSGGRCAWKTKLGPDGKARFSSLPPGRYTVFAMMKSHPATKEKFKVKTGKETDVVVKLKTGGRIGFRLLETKDDTFLGIPWVGFRIKRTGDPKPVFEDYRGHYWGNVVFLENKMPHQVFISLQPGEYLVEAVLRRENQAGVLGSRDDIWKYAKTIKVNEGEDAIIDIQWRR